MPKKIQLPDDFYNHDFKHLAKIEPHPRTRVRLIGLYHIQNGKNYHQVSKYLLHSISSVKQWVKQYKEQGIDGLKEKQRSGRHSYAGNQQSAIFTAIVNMQNNKSGGRVRLIDIKDMLADKFNIQYKDINGVYYLITRLGIRWISSRSKHPKQDQEAQDLYKKLQNQGKSCPTCGHKLKQG
jgi:transposase